MLHLLSSEKNIERQAAGFFHCFSFLPERAPKINEKKRHFFSIVK